jgi:thiamine kinase-like enzyme
LARTLIEAMDDSTELVRRVITLCPTWDPRDLADFQFLPGGYSNQNHRFRHRDELFVLRVPDRPRPFIDRELEQAFYESSTRILVPKIEAFDASTGIMISRWQSGPLLVKTRVDPNSLVPYLKSLHRDLPPCTRHYDPVASARAQLSLGLPEFAIFMQATALVWKPSDSAVCHNDLNPSNIIRTPSGEWMTLDWEWLAVNDPLFDLVTLHQGLFLDDDILAELSESLLGGAPSEERLRVCVTAFWLREYAWAHAERSQGNDRAIIHDQLQTSSRKLANLRSHGKP